MTKANGYRMHIQRAGKPDVLTTATFTYYADADRWATAYAKSLEVPCKVKIINGRDLVSACYLGDGSGHVRSASDEIGERLPA